MAFDDGSVLSLLRPKSIVGARDVSVEVSTPTVPLKNALGLTKLTSATECLSHKVDPSTGTCLDQKTIKVVEQFVSPQGGTAGPAVVQTAMKITGCDGSETCMISKVLDSMVAKNEIDRKTAQDIVLSISTSLKPHGPKNDTRWLDNINIDNTLAHWADEFKDFYPYTFCMRDFAKQGQSLEKTKLTSILEGTATHPKGISGPKKRMACVLNTDKSSGRGKHWVCVFVDCSGSQVWTIEYFNSSGNPPIPYFEEVAVWCEKSKRELEAYIASHPNVGRPRVEIVNHNQKHQESMSECGVFCLFYIRARLCGVSLDTLRGKRIFDQHMVEFRECLFSQHDLGSVRF